MTLDDHLVDYTAATANRDDDRWRPLKVTCTLIQPVLNPDDGLNLDGILSYGAYVSMSHDLQDELPPVDDAPWLIDFDLPVARWSTPLEAESAEQVDDRLLTPGGEVWGWSTSNQQAAWVERQKYDTYGRTPETAMKRETDKVVVNTSSGRYKPIAEHHEGLWPEGGQCVWYALGDPDGVADLLEHVPNIGAKHNVGYGKIECDLKGRPDWQVEVIDEDRSILDDGDLQRFMPLGFDDHYTSRPRPVRAPNWHRSRFIQCVGPEEA